MVAEDESFCPGCGGELKYYGKVSRIVRTKGGIVRWIKIRRLLCDGCGATHRELPGYLLPYKHYEAEIIKGFLSGEITSFEIEYEDYPCETTIKQWKTARKKQLL